MASTNPSSQIGGGEPQPPRELPELSPSDFTEYNRLAEHMDSFHNQFRQSWNQIYSVCARSSLVDISISQFLSFGLAFCHHLETHHLIEETYIFPMLARKMPEFQKQEHLLKQHEEIRKGLGLFQDYLESCKDRKRELRLEELGGIMDGFGKVLWSHLDDEVRMLGAENMRKYWSVLEMRTMG